MSQITRDRMVAFHEDMKIMVAELAAKHGMVCTSGANLKWNSGEIAARFTVAPKVDRKAGANFVVVDPTESLRITSRLNGGLLSGERADHINNAIEVGLPVLFTFPNATDRIFQALRVPTRSAKLVANTLTLDNTPLTDTRLVKVNSPEVAKVYIPVTGTKPKAGDTVLHNYRDPDNVDGHGMYAATVISVKGDKATITYPAYPDDGQFTVSLVEIFIEV